MPNIQELPANLSQPCDKLSTLDVGDGATITRWFLTNIPKHNSCARDKDAVVKAYNEVRNAINSIEEKP